VWDGGGGGVGKDNKITIKMIKIKDSLVQVSQMKK
jgi:hypothetical protein